MIETTQLIFQSRFHNNLLTVGIGLVGFDVPPVTVTALQEAVGPVNACLAILAVCEYIKLEPGSAVLTWIKDSFTCSTMSIFHPDLRPAVPTQVIHCCEGILKWQTPSLNDITIVCNIWVILKNMYLIFVVSEPFQSLPALHYSHSHWKMDTKNLHNSVNSFSSTLSVGVLCSCPGNLTLDSIGEDLDNVRT